MGAVAYAIKDATLDNRPAYNSGKDIERFEGEMRYFTAYGGLCNSLD